MSEWQPIETAPKDGTVIDIWVVGAIRCGKGHKRRVTDAKWSVVDRAWVQGGYFVSAQVNAWMPLPEPPKEAQP